LDKISGSRAFAEWGEILESCDLIWGKVQSTLDLPKDKQVTLNNYLVPFDHPIIGDWMWYQLPLAFYETPLSTEKTAPSTWENTKETLINRLGYSRNDISSLQDEGIIS
jgi:crotonobetainyl-CoA:carnitine CoA-transferase CaiB-like acyl-CoA transferase